MSQSDRQKLLFFIPSCNFLFYLPFNLKIFAPQFAQEIINFILKKGLAVPDLNIDEVYASMGKVEDITLSGAEIGPEKVSPYELVKSNKDKDEPKKVFCLAQTLYFVFQFYKEELLLTLGYAGKQIPPSSNKIRRC